MNMLDGPILSDLRYTPANREPVKLIAGVYHVQPDLRVSFHVPFFLTPFRGVYQHILAVVVNPYWRDLWRTSGHQGCQVRDYRLLEEVKQRVRNTFSHTKPLLRLQCRY